MSVQTVEQIEMFSEAELESLQFLPEELAEIQSELNPNLESISLEEVASDLEAYFVENLEEVELERFGFLKRLVKGRKRRSRSFKSPGKPPKKAFNRPGKRERDQIRDIKDQIRAGKWGKEFQNRRGRGMRLPRAGRNQHYREFDLGSAADGTRGTHRLVALVGQHKGKNIVIKTYYTNTHYQYFIPV